MQAIGTILIDVIVSLFFVGLAGSTVVILISFVEDFRVLFEDDDVMPEPATIAMATRDSTSEYSYNMSKSATRL
ncbi:MAG TPA: hypothetical protein VN753_08630 [Terracidiphilus sp.]|nr:hypothetical protein [Terracidiphilus sp.]